MSLSIHASDMQLMQSATQTSEKAALDMIDASTQNSMVEQNNAPLQAASGDLASPLLDLYQAEIEAAVGMKLIKTDSQLIGTLIDEKA